MKERGEVARAGEKVEDLKQQLADLEAELQGEMDKIKEAYQPESLKLEEIAVRPRKTDVKVEAVSVVWVPWLAAADGTLQPGHELARPS